MTATGLRPLIDDKGAITHRGDPTQLTRHWRCNLARHACCHAGHGGRLLLRQ